MRLAFETLSLLSALVVCGYLSYLCFTPPNSSPEASKRYKNDRLLGAFTSNILQKWIFVLGLSYLFVLILLPEYHSTFCLNPDVLNPALFEWSPYTVVFVLLILVFAPIRLSAYGKLGKDFTFQLAKPDKLITTGVYHYVQHPSYTGLLVMIFAWFWVFMRMDGVASCVLPVSIVNIKSLTFVPPLLMSLLALMGAMIRVSDEEAMLKKEFGKEWADYHQSTKRFIPGIF